MADGRTQTRARGGWVVFGDLSDGIFRIDAQANLNASSLRRVEDAAVGDDGIPFETKMKEMSQTLYTQMAEAKKLDEVIRQNLEVLGYGE